MNSELRDHFESLSNTELTNILRNAKNEYTEEAIDYIIMILKNRFPMLSGTRSDRIIEYVEEQEKKNDQKNTDADLKIIEHQRKLCNICGDSQPSIEIPFYAGKRGNLDYGQITSSALIGALANIITVPLAGRVVWGVNWVRRYNHMTKVSFLLCDKCAKKHAKQEWLSDNYKMKMDKAIKFNRLLQILSDECGFSLFNKSEYLESFCGGFDDEPKPLQKELDCPKCKKKVELEFLEQINRRFTCPHCNNEITDKDFIVNDAKNLLPEKVCCPNCSESIYLGEGEREDRAFICPHCREKIKL